MSKIEYSFQNDYSNLSAVSIPFTVEDKFGNTLYNNSSLTITSSAIYTGKFPYDVQYDYDGKVESVSKRRLFS